MTWTPLGQPIQVSTTILSTAGVPADPTGITMTLHRPDGTTVLYATPTHDGTGLYSQILPATDLTVAGHYRITWIATGSNADSNTEVLDVFDPATYPRLVSLADAKAFLRLSGTSDDAVLERYIAWASARILVEVEYTTRTVTDRMTLRGRPFALYSAPVRSLTSITPVTPYSPAVDITSLYVTGPSAGLVEAFGWVPHGVYDVTYVVGTTEVPVGVDAACLALIRHWWNQAQAHGSSTYGDVGFIPDVSGLPNTVRNMLESAPVRVWGVA